MYGCGSKILFSIKGLQRFPKNNITSAAMKLCERCYCTAEENRKKPVQYSTSEAAEWRAEYSRYGSSEIDHLMPSSQPYIVALSTLVFLLYFCVFREENDIDVRLTIPLYQQIEGLEETQLRVILEYNRERGIDTTDVEKRLNQLEQMKSSPKLLAS